MTLGTLLIHTAVVSGLIALYMVLRYRAEIKNSNNVASVKATVSYMRETIAADGNKMFCQQVPTFFLKGNIRVERIFSGHNLEIQIAYMEEGSRYDRHKHPTNAQVFLPAAGSIGVNMYKKDTDTEPYFSKTLCRDRITNPGCEVVAHCKANTWHELVALTDCEILSITIPPFIQGDDE